MINQKTFLITPSLLNSWLNIYNCVDYVREGANDTMCLEDKQSIAIEKAKEEFINALKRVRSEPNEYMLAGIKYEEDTYKGQTRATPYVEGGAYQIVGKKEKYIGDRKFLLYGRLDCLKGGVIYDIKKVVRYAPGKYLKSCQHWVYLELFADARYFEYLVDDGFTLHHEYYHREDMQDVNALINDFINYLKRENLIEIYEKYWLCN